jgi:hypothetical protein
MVRPGRRFLRRGRWDDRCVELRRYTPRTASSPVAILSRLDGATPRDVGAVWDVVAYGASAAVALAVLSTSGGALDRLWARVAVGGYGIGALAAWVLHRRGVGIRGRAILAAAVFAAVAVVPTILHADARVESAALPVKSDVLVVEQAAGSLLNGRNPYAVVHDRGPLATWPAWAQEHFPYLAAVLAVGVPRVVAGPAPWTDSRLVYLVLALATAVPSLLRSGLSAESRLRAFQVLFVLVTGAALAFTSGKEILVLGLLLASLIALHLGHALVSGVTMGAAAAMHQLAWVVLPILAFMPPRTPGRRAAMTAAAIAIAVVVPFLMWDAGAFIEDAVLYPLGFGQPASASALTPGGIVSSVMPRARWVLILLVGLAMIAGAVLAIRPGLRTASDVARWAGALLLLALLLAPRARLAYFALPANLLLWSRLLRARGEAIATDRPRPFGIRSEKIDPVESRSLAAE